MIKISYKTISDEIEAAEIKKENNHQRRRKKNRKKKARNKWRGLKKISIIIEMKIRREKKKKKKKIDVAWRLKNRHKATNINVTSKRKRRGKAWHNNNRRVAANRTSRRAWQHSDAINHQQASKSWHRRRAHRRAESGMASRGGSIVRGIRQRHKRAGISTIMKKNASAGARAKHERQANIE